jgi:hypothetical protein
MADYTDLRGRFVYKRPVYWSELDTLAENDAHLKENGWVAGTAVVFFQAAAPTGWTKLTTAGLDGRALRIVSGAGGSTGGGSQMLASAITLAHTHAVSNEAAHTHASAGLGHRHTWDWVWVNGDVTSSRFLTTDGTYLRRGKTNGEGGMGASTTAVDHDYSGYATPGLTAADAHDHGGVTGSSLADVSLSYANILLCTKDTSSGYTDLTSAFAYGHDINASYFISLAANDAWNLSTLIPQGTVALFPQATAPAGWTKTTVCNDHAARITTGAGGGYVDGQGVSQQISLSHAIHSITSRAAHTHPIAAHSHPLSIFSVNWGPVDGMYDLYMGLNGNDIQSRAAGGSSVEVAKASTADSTTGTTDSAGGHTHAGDGTNALANVSLAYVGALTAQKDAYNNSDYTSMVSFFTADNLLAWQDLETLSQNDQAIKSKQIPAATLMLFYQAAAPTGWTKSTAQNDKLVRVVSTSAAGGSGGSNAVSAGITLRHSHIILGAAHSHAIAVGSHGHNIGTGNAAASASFDTTVAFEYAGFTFRPSGVCYFRPPYTGGNPCYKKLKTFSGIPETDAASDSVSHAHGGATAEALTDVVLAYADVIACQKDA